MTDFVDPRYKRCVLGGLRTSPAEFLTMNNAKNIYSKKLEAENARKMAQHRRNLATMSSCVDNKPPKQYSHLKRNLKKEALMVSDHCPL